MLEIPPVACLNLHASLLPRHRGAAPIQAAILAGDTETGITVMYMDEGLDTGDILLKRAIPIAGDETGGRCTIGWRRSRRARSDGSLAICWHLEPLRAFRRMPAEATYAPKLEREHGQIDWSQPAEAIERKIRAFDPWPGAYTLLRDDGGKGAQA